MLRIIKKMMKQKNVTSQTQFFVQDFSVKLSWWCYVRSKNLETDEFVFWKILVCIMMNKIGIFFPTIKNNGKEKGKRNKKEKKQNLNMKRSR